MRAYALLLGVLLTVGSAAVAELALESVRPPRGSRPWRRVTSAAASGPVWNGGGVDPVTIHAPRPAPAPAPHHPGRPPRGPPPPAPRPRQPPPRPPPAS